jgi:hypothetical protein
MLKPALRWFDAQKSPGGAFEALAKGVTFAALV